MIQKSWDAKWEEIYAQQGFRGKYPDEAVVRFVAGKYFKVDPGKRKNVRILDLGCGPGRHILFLAKEGLSAFGIEGSPEAVKLCKEKLREEALCAKVRVGDFVRLPYPAGYFDAVIDCASIQHNRSAGIKKILREVRRTLKTGGELFSMVRTDRDYAYGKGKELEPGTFTDYTSLDLNNVGQIHFFSEAEITSFYSVFKAAQYEYLERTIENRTKRITHWAIRAIK